MGTSAPDASTAVETKSPTRSKNPSPSRQGQSRHHFFYCFVLVSLFSPPVCIRRIPTSLPTVALPHCPAPSQTLRDILHLSRRDTIATASITRNHLDFYTSTHTDPRPSQPPRPTRPPSPTLRPMLRLRSLSRPLPDPLNKEPTRPTTLRPSPAAPSAWSPIPLNSPSEAVVAPRRLGVPSYPPSLH